MAASSCLVKYFKFRNFFSQGVSSSFLNRQKFILSVSQHPYSTSTEENNATSHPPSNQSVQPNLLLSTPPPKQSSGRAQKIVKAMKAYLEKVVEYGEFIKIQNEEYELGRRHLARMMGEDPENFGTDDMAQAIRYLLPSALYDKKARPILKPPKEIFPTPKAAQFDYSGRPLHTFFYTGKANFYQALYDMAEKMHLLNAIEDEMIKRGITTAPPEAKFEQGGSDWISLDALEEIMIEKINEKDYNSFFNSMTRLCEHPYSNHVKDFIMQFRKTVQATGTKLQIPELKYEDSRPYIDAEGFRKTAKANIRVWGNGSGKITINGENILYFEAIQDREQVMFPLEFTDMLDKVDIEATVSGPGISGQSGAIRHGISLALCSFVSKEMVEKMRLAGLLTRDRRTRERKKPGQKGARAKYTWKKR